MNNEDRKQLEVIKTKLEPILEELDAIFTDLEDRTCNFEEIFDGSERADLMREKTDGVMDIKDDMQTLISNFDEVIQWKNTNVDIAGTQEKH